MTYQRDLGNLSTLRYLFLASNALNEGPIPSWIGGNLTNLVDLSLRETGRTGEIPESFGNLTNLTMLDLSHNNLMGQVPRQLGELSKLRFLLLDHNQLTGSIPADLERLSLGTFNRKL